MRDVSSVEFSGAQQICYSHLPPGFFVSGQRRLWERQLSPTQSIGCWWTSRRFWWRSRETCRLFSCSCKDHKIFPSSPVCPDLLVCRAAVVRRQNVSSRQRVGPGDVIMFCWWWFALTEIDYFQFMHERRGQSWSSRFRHSSALTSAHLRDNLSTHHSAGLTGCSDEKWSGSVRWIILLLRSSGCFNTHQMMSWLSPASRNI